MGQPGVGTICGWPELCDRFDAPMEVLPGPYIPLAYINGGLSLCWFRDMLAALPAPP